MKQSPIIKPQATSLKMETSKILPQIKKIKALIIIDLALIAAALLFFNHSNLDVEIQNYLFDFESKTWLIDRDEPIKKFIFYKLPKIIFGVAIIGLLIDRFWFKKQRYTLILLGLIIIPLIAGNIKKFTNIYCPNQLEIYDGDKPYVKIFEHYPSGFAQKKTGQCFPAGHAVTGFSLFILFFALAKKSRRIFGFFVATISGWILGFYQMAKGVHFFSDTLISMLVCFLLSALIYKFYYRFLESKNDK